MKAPGMLRMTNMIKAMGLALLLVTQVFAAEATPDAMRWKMILDAAGVSAVLAQTDELINQEVANLKKTPLGFTTAELQELRQRLLQRLGHEQLQADVIARVQAGLDPQQQQSLQKLLLSPRTRFMQTLQAQLNDAVVREAMRTYKVQVKENAPASHRVELITQLDDSLQQTALETELKVELRKQLLVMVTQLKTNETFSESMLDEQLTAYRRDVEDAISRNALYAYLYLFKRTPTPQVEAIIASYNQPAYEQFMALCHDAVQASFRVAREQLLNDMRIAKQ